MIKLLRYTYILLIIAAATGYEVSAQGTDLRSNFRPGNTGTNRTVKPASRVGKKLEVARDNFLSQQLDLTDDEATKFWPIYHRYQEELKAVRILKRINNSSASTNGTDQINKDIYYENQLLMIRKHYRDEFLKILPPEKVSELYKGERQFTDELIKQLSERSIRAGN
ncbi:hypothetical protein A0256_24075 [Mucilaginibacter sp. PAMC 26640]|nr:hypothetical protein A0256_24075 [Mucilaginibacter sp. PAMC 26640]